MPVTPHTDDDPLHRIGTELRRPLAGTLVEPLPGDMQVLLHRLERVEMEWRRRDRQAPGRGRAAASVCVTGFIEHKTTPANSVSKLIPNSSPPEEYS